MLGLLERLLGLVRGLHGPCYPREVVKAVDRLPVQPAKEWETHVKEPPPPFPLQMGLAEVSGV